MKKGQASMLFNIIIGIILILISLIIFSLINSSINNGMVNSMKEMYNTNSEMSYAGVFLKINDTNYIEFTKLIANMTRHDRNFFRHKDSRTYYETYMGDLIRKNDRGKPEESPFIYNNLTVYNESNSNSLEPFFSINYFREISDFMSTPDYNIAEIRTIGRDRGESQAQIEENIHKYKWNGFSCEDRDKDNNLCIFKRLIS